MQAVGNQGGRPDLAADPDAIERHQFVAEEPDDTGGGHPAEIVDRSRVNQPAHGLVAGQQSGEGDHDEYEQTGEVLGPTQPVGVALAGRSTAQDERDPQRDRGERIGEVVDRVGGQGDRPGKPDDDQLKDRGEAEDHQADLDRPDALRAGGERIVYGVGVVVAMGVIHWACAPRLGPVCSPVNSPSPR